MIFVMYGAKYTRAIYSVPMLDGYQARTMAIDPSMQTQAIGLGKFERVILDTTVQEKAIGQPEGRVANR